MAADLDGRSGRLILPLSLRSLSQILAMILAVPMAFPMTVGVAIGEPAIQDGPSPPVEAWGKAMQSGDLKALAQMHGPNTVAFPPGAMKLQGGDAIGKDYEGLFSKFTVKVKVDEAHWLQEGPLVVSWGISTLTLHPKTGDGKDVTTKTRFTDVATKVDGIWRYVVDHASVPISN